MKIRNDTDYRTDHLRAIIQRVAVAELDPNDRKRLLVEVAYRRNGQQTIGKGAIGALWIRLTIERDTPDKVLFAHIVAHELAHNRGLQHRGMKGSIRYDYVDGWREYYGWAEAMPLEKKELKTKPKSDLQIMRYQRVLELEKGWRTKLKRAETALKKLRRKRRYYERALVAAGKLPASEVR
ncbi:MAG: hypothetical protein AB1631_19775 [Acidobacteriota bacterium]